MLTIKSKWMRLGLLGMALVLVIGLAALAMPKKVSAAPVHNVGVVCTNGTYNTGTNVRSFNLVAQEGYITLTDGNTMYMWGFGLAPSSGNANTFQYPGPVLCANAGEIVSVTLQNALTQNDVSIIFPGQTAVSANGALSQPQFNGSTLTSLATAASARVLPAAMGGSVTYSFTAANPGTYIYESGTDTRMQVGMGLFGVLIVHPSGHTDYVYDANSQITPGEDFLAVLSEIDPLMHQAIEAHKNFNMNNYHPRYWVLNGRGFPDTIADNFASWLPTQPYGALALIQPYGPNHPFPAVERFVNVGTEDYPFHPHGQNGLVIARDGHLLKNGTDDLSMEKFLVNIGPGQTWDVLFKWHDAEGYSDAYKNGTAPFPVTIPDVANQTMGMFYSGSPFLGVKGTLPPGQSTLNECGEYYIISHNHALFQLDAWGQTMSGQITYLRIDPPGGCK